MSIFNSENFLLRDEGKHLIWQGRVAVLVHPKPMVVGGRVFGEDGWEPTL